jgi:hypothetical protein
MEINRFEQVYPAITISGVVEGRFVLFGEHTNTYDFGSHEDLPGVKVPADSTEAAKALFIVAWAADNRKPPYFTPLPSYTWTLRKGGFGGPANIPFSAEVDLTYPGYQDSRTIPAGVPCLAFGEGTFTFTEGNYVAASGWAVGSFVEVANAEDDTADEAGKPKLLASGTKVGVVEAINSDNSIVITRL